MKRKAYPNYKPSGVEWLGEVPEDWEVKKLKYISSLKSGEGITVEDIQEEDEYPVFGGNGLRGFTNQYTHNGEYVLIGRQGALCGNINYAKRKFWASEHAVVATPIKITAVLWLGELLRTMNLNQYSLSAAQPGLAIDRIKELFIPVPPLPEQQAIAAYLDRETSRIDSLIAKKQRLLSLLDERRTALISRAVTKGLDVNVEMKPSGMEWLGNIPENWKIKKVKHGFPRLLSGVSVNSESNQADEGEPGVLKTSCVYGNKFTPSENKKIVEDEVTRASCPVRKNSLIISRMNTPELVGNCGFIDRDYFNLFLPDRLWIATFTSRDQIYSKYAWYLLTSRAYVLLTGALATGTSDSMKNLSQESFLNIAIPFPPLPEQQAIATYIDRETAKIDALSAKVETIIERLKEYRTALISEAVTGKIDVREGEPYE